MNVIVTASLLFFDEPEVNDARITLDNRHSHGVTMRHTGHASRFSFAPKAKRAP